MSKRPVPLVPADDMGALAKGGQTNILGFGLRLVARVPFLFIAGRIYGADLVGRFALSVVVVELAALVATIGFKRGLAQAFASDEKRDPSHIVFDALAVSLIVSVIASALLIGVPDLLYSGNRETWIERLLPLVVFAVAWSDVTLAALAYRHDVGATVRARAVIEPWTISIAAFVYSFIAPRDGLPLAYATSMAAALAASLYPFFKSYGWPRGWRPEPRRLWRLARRNLPLSGAEAVEWGTRNVDRMILGLMFEPRFVGIYYMAQQISSIPQKLKTSFDPVLGPVITASLAEGDKQAVAQQVCQVSFWIVTAQTCIALMFAIPGPEVMAVIGPQFTAGATALVFLLLAEVAATQGAVSEAALVYTARHRNLMISAVLLGIQIGLSFALIFWGKDHGWSPAWLAAAPAIALCATLGMTSVIKAHFLGALLGRGVWGWRWPLFGAAAVAGAIGAALTALPSPWALLQLGGSIVATAVIFLFVMWKWAFTDADRTLFKKMPGAEAAMPVEKA